jgi:hypothetical protein
VILASGSDLTAHEIAYPVADSPTLGDENQVMWTAAGTAGEKGTV